MKAGPRFPSPTNNERAAPSSSHLPPVATDDAAACSGVDFEELAERFLELCKAGRPPDIEAVARGNPEWAREIRELFPTIETMESLRLRKEGRGADGRASMGPVRLQRLGDFRILAEIGRGGMGVVYEAEQESLRRRVAVKVLPRQLVLDAKQLARFQREAETAARLQHPNIVPVFGVGEQDGYHFYIMQLIEGVGLDRLLDGDVYRDTDRPRDATAGASGNGDADRKATMRSNDRTRQQPPNAASALGRRASSPALLARPAPAPAPPGKSGIPHGDIAAPPLPWPNTRNPAWVARVGVQVSRALQYAHAHGVLHRDIKPGNLLLDAEHNVWITDFGLAKWLGHDSLSHSGQLLGTLRYMAPEQFGGEEDGRTDVYSLGITLYEFLTGRPAFGVGQATQLIDRIRQGRLEPPRQIDPSIPQQLETIILKAVAVEPAHRYPTAGALSQDLERFLNDRPVRARRASPFERLWQWSRRNKALAAMSSCAILLLAVQSATLAWYFAGPTELAVEPDTRIEAPLPPRTEPPQPDRPYAAPWDGSPLQDLPHYDRPPKRGGPNEPLDHRRPDGDRHHDRFPDDGPLGDHHGGPRGGRMGGDGPGPPRKRPSRDDFRRPLAPPPYLRGEPHVPPA